jgi:hypothetical protein
MTATVEIQAGYKTVLEYIFQPLQNVSQGLRERYSINNKQEPHHG